jgi:hypothetical protein
MPEAIPFLMTESTKSQTPSSCCSQGVSCKQIAMTKFPNLCHGAPVVPISVSVIGYWNFEFISLEQRRSLSPL